MTRLVTYAGTALAPITLAIAMTIGVAIADSRSASADDHTHHVKHNMLLLGETEIFASHIVYKAPHNYQVVLRVELPEAARTAYLAARTEHPEELFVLLLDPTDISMIQTAEQVSGKILRETASGERVAVAEAVTLASTEFSVVFFDELPLSLAP